MFYFNHDSVFSLLNQSKDIIRNLKLCEMPASVTFKVKAIDLHINSITDNSITEFLKLVQSNSSLVWKIKVKLNDNGLVGVFFSPRTTNESGNLVNGTNSSILVNKFGNFRSALYNIELENRSEAVFKNVPSIYSFPLTENYFFGPSNIADVSDLLEYCHRNNKDDFTIKVWLTECVLHSAVMNYIGKNFTKIMSNCSIESLKNIEVKDFICLLE